MPIYIYIYILPAPRRPGTLPCAAPVSGSESPGKFRYGLVVAVSCVLLSIIIISSSSSIT